MDILQHHSFRVTRNEDVEVEEDDAENLLHALEKELTRRRFGPPVRLEVAEDIDDHVLDLLVRELGMSDSEVYRLPAPLDLTGLNLVADLDRSELRYPPFVPKTHRDLNVVETASAPDVFAAVRARDVLLHHPYDSFSTSVQAFVEQAAADPRVLAIKQTLYRTSGDSPIVDALVDAAEAGKQVLAIVEIKARFDEQANISWARKLEQAGGPRRLRDRRPEDAREALPRRPAGEPRAAPLLPHRHGQLQPQDRPAVRGLRPPDL
jgi:polyphosphate kinase